MRDGIVEIDEAAAVGEGIWRDVQDADNDQAIRPGGQGHYVPTGPAPVISASARVRGSLWKMPRTAEVTVSAPGLRMPRMAMQRCSA